jgi:hypothetical protein
MTMHKVPEPIKAKTNPLYRGRDLATEMNLIKNELGRLGMFKTMHAMDEATRALGWELSERIEKQSA